MIARFCTGIELSNAVVQALALVVPRQVCGGCGNGGGLILTGQQGNNFWVQVELFSGSYGGRYGSDGMDSVDVLYANTRNNPIERDPADVLDDVIDEYITRDKALADYGVVITEGFEVDAKATSRERQARAAKRSN